MYLNRLEFKNDVFIGIDPRCRIGTGVCLILSSITISHPLILGGCILGLFLCLIRDIPTVLLRLIPVNLLAVVLWLTLPLSGLDVRTALGEALVYTLRINTAALLYMVTIIPLGPGGLANALIKLRCPDKLTALFLLTYRYIFVMYERVFVSVRSMLIRRPRQSTLGRWSSYTAVFGTALISAVQRAQKAGKAMEVRGFDGVIPMTRMFSWKGRDTLFLSVGLSLSCILRILDRLLTGKLWNF
ncbi:energy-coupling factor transporter transmembrane protein EcfT [Treponema sp. TIM-1]|uniref:energy-coupling factor transporter transmembrane component T family protein n=1 Tax=Treponema sp. TIM-1 TaxID=2898417 RepID=UPI0039814393